MKRINIRIEGVTPLLMNKFTDEAQQSATSGRNKSLRGDRGTPKEQAEKLLYTNDDTTDGQVIVPQPNVFRCILDAGKFFKNGKSKVTTQKSSIIPSCVSMEEMYFPLDYKEDWKVDTRPVRIPSTGGRIQKHRPCFHKWGLNFELLLDEQEMGEKMLRDIIDKAGMAIGLGDFRPDCKGIFGKFKVTEWKVKDN